MAKDSAGTSQGSAWTPKVGQFCFLTETDTKKKVSITTLFLVTEIGSQTAPKVDDKGKPVLETVDLPATNAPGGKVKRTRNVLETVANYSGISFSANQQFSVPKKNVLIGALSQLEA